MRDACLIMRKHLNDDAKALKSKEVVRACMLLKTSSHSRIFTVIRLSHNFLTLMKTTGDFLLIPLMKLESDWV